MERNEPDKAIEIIERFLETPEAEAKLVTPRQLGKIGMILLQQGKFDEAEAYFIPGMRTHASWGLSDMAKYREIVGDFDVAEKLLISQRDSYPETGPFALWAFRYSTNQPELQESTDEILQQYARYIGANPQTERATWLKNRMLGYQIIYPCYCMDLPYPDSLGQDALAEEFLRGDGGTLGFLAWFDAKEKGDEKKAARLLRLLRDQWFLNEKIDPFVEAQRPDPLRVQTSEQNRKGVNYGFQSLAALFEFDQRQEQPGRLNQEEVDYLIRLFFKHDLAVEEAPWLLYLFGRYYDLCGEKDKALDCYRRVLGFRAEFSYFLRCLAVKELRKSGMTDEEFVQWSQADPRIPRQKLSPSHTDFFCRQHFRDYSDSPSASVLARPVAAKPVVPGDIGKPTTRTPGWYKVTSVLFRGEAIPETESVVYWMVPEEKDGEEYRCWHTSGIATCTPNFWTLPEQRRPDGVYSLRFGEEKDGLPALAAFHDDKLTLVVSLKPEEEPDGIVPKPESSFVRVDMIKVADVPPEEPTVPVAGHGVSTFNAAKPKVESESDEMPAWMRHVRLAAIAVTSVALVLALVLSTIKRRRKRNDV